MFSSSPIKATFYSDGILNLETMDKAYLLHAAFDLDLPIKELEVKSTRAECQNCAKLVHTSHRPQHLHGYPGRSTYLQDEWTG
jgi:hypothetical protein